LGYIASDVGHPPIQETLVANFELAGTAKGRVHLLKVIETDLARYRQLENSI